MNAPSNEWSTRQPFRAARPSPLSAEEKSARAPLPVDVLACALQERIHVPARFLRQGRLATRLQPPANPRWGLDPYVAAYSRACFDEVSP